MSIAAGACSVGLRLMLVFWFAAMCRLIGFRPKNSVYDVEWIAAELRSAKSRMGDIEVDDLARILDRVADNRARRMTSASDSATARRVGGITGDGGRHG